MANKDMSDVEAESEAEEEPRPMIDLKDKIYRCEEGDCKQKLRKFQRRNDFDRHLEQKHKAMTLPSLSREQLIDLGPYSTQYAETFGSGYIAILPGQTRGELKKELLRLGGSCKRPQLKKNSTKEVAVSPERKIRKLGMSKELTCKMITTKPPVGRRVASGGSEAEKGSEKIQTRGTASKMKAIEPKRISHVEPSDAFGQVLLNPPRERCHEDYPNYDESLSSRPRKTAIRITAVSDPRMHSYPATHPATFQFQRDDPTGITDWLSNYPPESAIDILIIQYDAMQIAEMEQEYCLESEEEEEELDEKPEVLWSAWGFEEIHSLAVWEQVVCRGVPFDADELMGTFSGAMEEREYLNTDMKVNLIVLTARETARMIFLKATRRPAQKEAIEGDSQSGTVDEMEEESELDIKTVRKIHAMGVSKGFFTLNTASSAQDLPTTEQLYRLAQVSVHLPVDHNMRELMQRYEQICPHVAIDKLLDLAALHMRTMSLVGWTLLLAGAELAAIRTPVAGSMRLDRQWILDVESRRIDPRQQDLQ